VVREQLAAGGMGVVCRVFDRSAGEERAMKRLGRDGLSDPALMEAFEREYQVLAGVDHPRIIRVFDYGVDTAGPYYTMELLDGDDMRSAAPLFYRDACRYLRDVATSLALLHARRLLHRDPSPANVRITPDGHCKLLDFGALSAFGNSRLVVGTPPLIPPEAVEGAPLDQRADLYSLGALAYWMLTGRHAYPALEIHELAEVWKAPPPAPSTVVAGVPEEMDALVLGMLSRDPLARPASAAEVIARLNMVGELAPEQEGDAERLAESFLRSARFVGRAAQLEQLEVMTDELLGGRGRAVRIEAAAGMGRSRLLEELGVRAQISGGGVLRVDASTYRDNGGTARALAVRLLDAFPQLSHEHAKKHAAALAELGREVEARLFTSGSVPPRHRLEAVGEPASAGGSLDGWFAEVSRSKPLLIEVDNVDDADDASLAFLVGLVKQTSSCPLMLVLTERERVEPRTTFGLVTLRAQCETMRLEALSPFETLELARSLFGDPPSVERYAEWLYARTAGSPLHCIELSRQLVARGVIRYADGIWMLPLERFDAEVPAELQDALSARLASLSDAARGLAECLSLLRDRPTLALCRLLAGEANDRSVLLLLDELARSDVLYTDRDGYRFSSTALREAILGGMDDARREQNHTRLGEALVHLIGPEDHALRIEAGWHLIRGGRELEGAGLVLEVARDSATMRNLFANLCDAGEALEAALRVYKRHRRSVYERMPLLAALAHAGYYEDRRWGETYGDEALDVCEDLAGVRAARRLSRFVGRWLGLVLGLLGALVKFRMTPRRERPYPFSELYVQLFGCATALSGAAALSLDVERAARVSDVIEIFSVLPARSAPAGIHAFCAGLREIGREQQGKVFEKFDLLRRRFGDPRYYRGLPANTRNTYVAAALFARGAFAVMRADSSVALECADALEACGLKLYAMIASQLRFLCFALRGELAKAVEHHEQVELHAARIGSVWQVETWEQATLIPLYVRLEDVVALTRAESRLQTLGRTLPSLRRYSRLAAMALLHLQRDAVEEAMRLVRIEVAEREPRSYIGWTSTAAFMAGAFNRRGRFAEAKAACELVLPHLTDEDREYVALFLEVDLEMAVAQAGLGELTEAFARVDGLIERFRGCDHPMLQGCLREARARICRMAGRLEDCRHELTMMDHWFRSTGTPALIAKCDHFAAMLDGQHSAGGSGRLVPPAPSSASAVADEAVPEAKTVVAVRGGPKASLSS
jgi:hypothetical protein